MAKFEKAPPTRYDFYCELTEGKDASNEGTCTTTESNIPRRYRKGHDRINVEQVWRDQRRVRREFVRSIIRALKRHLFS